MVGAWWPRAPALVFVFHLFRDDGAGKAGWWLMMMVLLYHSCICISI